MKMNNERSRFEATSKIENLVIDKMWASCRTAHVEQNEEGLGILYVPDTEHKESDINKCIQILREYNIELLKKLV